MDVDSHKFSTFTPNLPSGAGTNSQSFFRQEFLDDDHQAPTLRMTSLTTGEAGEMWFAVQGKGLRHFRSSDGKWDSVVPACGMEIYLDMAADLSRGQLLLANREHGILDGEKSKSGGLIIYNYRQNTCDALQIYQGLPSNDITAVARDGDIAWVGGRGFVAVIDIVARKVLRIAYISASTIKEIQLSQVHTWIAISCDKEGYPEQAGNARTGVYRLDRSAIEPAANRK
jgi:hypothetical protein